MKVLIVEDSRPMRRILRQVVGKLADEVYECSDGCEALAAYGEQRPDWVLMDIKMDGMDGLQATRSIKARFPEAKVVIVSNYDDEDMRQAAHKAGAVGFVAKDNLLDMRRFLDS
ncbi:MAG TPA: response regulator [Blastocatellia bacterium]|nr:response regulator [Blastocatellia bacterium]